MKIVQNLYSCEKQNINQMWLSGTWGVYDKSKLLHQKVKCNQKGTENLIARKNQKMDMQGQIGANL